MGSRISSFKAEVVEEKPVGVEERVWSKQQEQIFWWFEGADLEMDHLVVRARAGTGKTTTIIEGVNRAPEDSILVCAFNKKIAEELNSRITNPNAEAKTLHALGFAAVRRQWYGIPVATGSVRADSLTDMVVPKECPKPIRRLISQLHTKARDMSIEVLSFDRLLSLALEFDLIPDDGWSDYSVEFVAARAQEAMSIAATQDPTRDIGIDFADMIFLPLAWKLLSKDYDMVVVDEAQDLTLAQLEMAQRVCSGRICVVGDDRQCQPAGTMVRSTVSGSVPIETLKIGDTIESFDRHGQVFIKSGRVLDVASRQYMGGIITVFSRGRSSRCTPNHKWLVRWVNKDTPAWVTYLMRQGDRYRVGQCQLFYDGGLFGLSNRARTEGADAAWILRIHKSQEEALGYEQVLSARYGLPEMIFKPCSNIKYFTQEVIDFVYMSLNSGEQRTKALRCLTDHRREEAYPIYDRPGEFVRRGRTTLFETQACNLIDSYMAVPVAPIEITGHDKKDRHAVSWSPLEIGYESFDGLVYSLDIERYHKYVADGLVTCNSIYGFRGADSGSLDRLKGELQAGELPLTGSYRCSQEGIRLAQKLVPDITAVIGNPKGQIDHMSYKDLLGKAEPGQFVLSRLNAPLVRCTLAFLKRRKRAKMAGRDIGAGIRGIIQKVGGKTVETLLTKLTLWESKNCTRFAAYGQVALVDRTRDQADMIRSLAEEAEDMDDLLNRIEWLFTDDVGDEGQILCSSIHKAKGLEAERVWIMQESLYCRGWSQEEANLEYVAITRAKNHLTFVTGVPGLGAKRGK